MIEVLFKFLMYMQRVAIKFQGIPYFNEAHRVAGYEVRKHLQVSNRGCDNILDAYGSSERERGKSPHLNCIYMEYDPFGNIHDLVTECHNLG